MRTPRRDRPPGLASQLSTAAARSQLVYLANVLREQDVVAAAGLDQVLHEAAHVGLMIASLVMQLPELLEDQRNV